jgi:hypothetical protein
MPEQVEATKEIEALDYPPTDATSDPQQSTETVFQLAHWYSWAAKAVFYGLRQAALAFIKSTLGTATRFQPQIQFAA